MLAKPLPRDRDPLAVYANNELKLSEIDVYGFDYDYTVACYSDSLNPVIYNMGRANLMQYNKAGFSFVFTVCINTGHCILYVSLDYSHCCNVQSTISKSIILVCC